MNGRSKILIIASLISLFFGGRLISQQTLKQVVETMPVSSLVLASQPPQLYQTQYQEALVTRVVDGDTIEVNINGQNQKLRYIGMDTPETVDPRRPVGCFGKEASDENKSLVEGKQVLLEKDVSETDKFGRLLRYVYLKIDNGQTLFVNDYLVREGYARVSTFPPDVKYTARFIDAQREATLQKRGLWSKCI